MSRQQFLAELAQYLTFVTPDEREQIIAVFEEKFDSVGHEGENALLMELGTPMSIAIAFKRRKEAGEMAFSNMPGKGEQEIASEEEAEAYEQVCIEEAIEPEIEHTASTASTEEAASEPTPEVIETAEMPEASVTAPLYTEEEIPAMSAHGAPPKIRLEEPAPHKSLTAGAAIGATLLSIIITAIFLIPAALGGYLIIIMLNFIFGALQTLSTLPDALWMLAIGFACGAVGVLLLWFFIWAIISIIRRLFRGKPAKNSGFRRGMKKTWKVIWIIFVIFLVIGIGCGVGGYFSGTFDLLGNPKAQIIIDWISNNTVANLFYSLFG